jgi:sterol desaturase/sphingolipid hydroxylase (fatty acid hydroxylase superfamily)
MGLLTTEHGRAGYLADFILLAAAWIALAVVLVTAGPHERRFEFVVLALSGIAAWTLVEYALHRFVLHGLQPFRDWHVQHHRRPHERTGTPIILSGALIALLVLVPAWVLGDLWSASPMTFGLLTGYLIYATVHHAVHHWHVDAAWLRRLQRHHALHHSGIAESSRYGVTSALWDVVFRTDGRSAPGASE